MPSNNYYIFQNTPIIHLLYRCHLRIKLSHQWVLLQFNHILIIIICYDNMIQNIRDSEETGHWFSLWVSQSPILTDNFSCLRYTRGDQIVKYHKLLCLLPPQVATCLFFCFSKNIPYNHTRDNTTHPSHQTQHYTPQNLQNFKSHGSQYV